jgi:hypothetical protein
MAFTVIVVVEMHNFERPRTSFSGNIHHELALYSRSQVAYWMIFRCLTQGECVPKCTPVMRNFYLCLGEVLKFTSQEYLG